MTLVFQPVNSSICGQCVVATITGWPLDDIIKLYFKHSHSTRTSELVQILSLWNIKLPDRLIRGVPTCNAIVKITWAPKGSHWSLYDHATGTIHCSCYGTYPANLMYAVDGRITSYLPLPNNVVF